MKVKLNGTIKADKYGTYMMCGKTRVPVVVQNADGEIISVHVGEMDDRGDTSVSAAGSAGKDDGKQ